MFQLAHIVPTAYLGTILDHSRIQMSLAHLMLADKSYREFYTAHKGLLLLDNGLYENSQVTEDVLLSLLKETLARRRENAASYLEIVAPDSLYDGPDTVRRSEEFVKMVRDALTYDEFNQLRFMFVPQGASVAEWKECLNGLVNIINRLMPVGNATVALSKLSCPKSFAEATGSDYVSINRIAAHTELRKVWKGTVHLLGAGVPYEWKYYLLDPTLRSCDTSLAAQMAVRNTTDIEASFPHLGSPGMDTHLNFDEVFDPQYESRLFQNIYNLDQMVKRPY